MTVCVSEGPGAWDDPCNRADRLTIPEVGVGTVTLEEAGGVLLLGFG